MHTELYALSCAVILNAISLEVMRQGPSRKLTNVSYYISVFLLFVWLFVHGIHEIIFIVSLTSIVSIFAAVVIMNFKSQINILSILVSCMTLVLISFVGLPKIWLQLICFGMLIYAGFTVKISKKCNKEVIK